MESDLKLIQECGFNSFEDVVKRIKEIVDIMRVGRAKAEKNLIRFNNQAKEFLKSGQKDKAKKELAKKKKKEERIKMFDTQFNVILEKLLEVKNTTKMLQVLNATKYCNSVLLAELKENEVEEETTETKEYQDLLENDKEVTKYIEIILKATKKPEKIKQNIPEAQQLEFPDLDFDNDQNQIEHDPNAELQLIKQCGFNSLGDALKRIIYFIEVMKYGNKRLEKNLERYVNQAKEYLKSGQKDEAKKELTIKKQKEEKIKTLNNKLSQIAGKLKEVKNSNHILIVLNVTKFCNNLLMDDLSKNEMGEETKEYLDLNANSNEINKYIQIINSFISESNQNYPGNNNQGPENNNIDDITFPSDSI